MNKHISNIQDSVNDASKNISKVQNLLDQFPNAEGADINADNVAKDLNSY